MRSSSSSLCFGPVDKLILFNNFIDSSCNDRICGTCGQDHSFSPTFVDVKTSIDAIQKPCDSYASAFVITRRRRVVS